jgi:hypothetical protein
MHSSRREMKLEVVQVRRGEGTELAVAKETGRRQE